MKYILLFILASTIVFASCSNMDPAHYDTPKKKKAVSSSRYSLRVKRYPINHDRKILRDNGEAVTLYINDSIAVDTVWSSSVPAMKAEDYPLNKWREEHEKIVLEVLRTPEDPNGKTYWLNEGTNTRTEYVGRQRSYCIDGEYDRTGPQADNGKDCNPFNLGRTGVVLEAWCDTAYWIFDDGRRIPSISTAYRLKRIQSGCQRESRYTPYSRSLRDVWSHDNTGFEALKDVELYSFWK